VLGVASSRRVFLRNVLRMAIGGYDMTDTNTEEAIGTFDFLGNTANTCEIIDAARTIYESFDPLDHFCIRCNVKLADRTIGYCLDCLANMASS
jgi:hypothetical protein